METIKIKSIKNLGIGNTYDLKVYPNRNFFLSNGILSHNSGKSTLALQLGRYIDPTLNLKRIVFSPEDFKEQVFKAKKGEVIIYDEAFTGLSSRASLSGINRYLVSLMMQMRQKNLCVILVLPTFFLLDRYPALFRSKVLIHVYENKGRRGYYRIYNSKKKTKLWFTGKKDYTYHVRTKVKGHFYGVFALGDKDEEKKYRNKKAKALEDVEKNPMSAQQIKYMEQRNILLYLLKKETGLSFRKLEKYLDDFNLNVSYNQIRLICNKYGISDNEEVEKELLEIENEGISSKIDEESEDSDDKSEDNIE